MASHTTCQLLATLRELIGVSNRIESFSSLENRPPLVLKKTNKLVGRRFQPWYPISQPSACVYN